MVMAVVGKPRAPVTFSVNPKNSRMRSVLSKIGHQSTSTGWEKTKKPRPKKGNELTNYEMLKKGAVPDYTDVAYREAVSRLRYLLNESYVPPITKYSGGGVKPEESDEESGVSVVATDRTRTARLSPYRRPYMPTRLQSRPQQNPQTTSQYREPVPEIANIPGSSPELMGFIERQEEYIDQLEKEAQYCRDELSQLLGKVKQLIAENESLQEQQKSNYMKNVFEGLDDGGLNDYQNPDKYRKPLEGPSIVFESRISELEAQLTQSRIDLRKAQDEAETYKRRLEESQPSPSNYDFYKQIENLQREKRDLNESLAKLQASINQIREKEIDASKKVQRTLDVVDKTQFEKQQAEMEVYRLKSELELQHDKLLEVISEQTRKVADERGQAERRYLQHVERLNAELAAQRDNLSKMQMDVERHLRIEEDLKRDLATKNMTIESVKKELNNKIGSLQGELSSALRERDAIEQELNTSRMSGERTDRLNKQESSRLQVEISALRQRLDRGDAELIHCRRENLRLLEQISTLEKELTLYKIKLGEKKDPIEEEEEQAKEKLLNSRISEIESKHVERVSELEGLIENQSQVMAQLKAECQSLTQKLEESSARHKQEMENLQSKLNNLDSKMESNFGTKQWNLGETSKEPQALEKTQYQTKSEERKLEPVTENYNQRFLQEESQRPYEGQFDQSYSNQQQLYQSPQISQENNYGNMYGDGSGTEQKQEGYEGQNNYPSYASEQQQQQSLYQQQPQSFQEPTSFQEQQQSYQEQSYQDPSSFSEQQRYQSQSYGEQHFADQLYQEQSYQEQQNVQPAEEQLQSYTEVPPEPAPPPEPPEVQQPEPKPEPKTSTSQRFRQAAELSRQASKTEETKKLGTQRQRNIQAARNQQKAGSARFK